MSSGKEEPIGLVDTHAHLYAKEFDEDREALIEWCLERGINKIYLPNIDESSYDLMVELEKAHPQMIRSMIGIHPCYVTEDYLLQLSFVKRKLEERDFSAVGEIGIDLYWNKSNYKIQEKVFRAQIELSLDYQLPIVIHARDSLDEIIQVLNDYSKRDLRGILHCFTGNLTQSQQLIDLGFLLGIGGIVTFKNAGLDKVVKEIPLENLVLETDSPYLAPVPYRGKRNNPAYTYEIALKVALLKECSLEEVKRQTTNNAMNIFNEY